MKIEEKIAKLIKGIPLWVGLENEAYVTDSDIRQIAKNISQLFEKERQEIFDFIERHHYQSIMAEITKGKIGMDGFWVSKEELQALKSRKGE